MKVLFLGYSGYHTLIRLTKAIKGNSNGITIAAASIVSNGMATNSTLELEGFDEIVNIPRKQETSFNGKNRFTETFRMMKNRKKRNMIFKYLLFFKFSSIKNLINSETEEYVYSLQLKKLFEQFDVFHFQYISPDTLSYLKYIGKEKKIILSFWGSDLLQTAGKKNYNEQLKAIERCDAVTVSTIELREILLSKFGRQFSNKINLASFLIDETVFNKVNNDEKIELINKFKHKNNIPPGKICMIVGYSAAPTQRHVDVLNILGNLKPEIKDRIHIIIPMTYGLEFEGNGYLNEVIEASKSCGITSTILTEYITGDDLHGLIYSGEIKLNVRDSDAMNAAMLESLGTGSLVINGAWLPYGMLRRLGIYFREVENHSQLVQLITNVIENFDDERKKVNRNPDIIKKHFTSENLAKGWIDLYNKLKETSSQKN